MQTFLPYVDFVKSANCLDDRRLGKQRVEVLQILNTLNRLTKPEIHKVGWYRHPTVLMWKGYKNALMVYGNKIINEWKDRGFKNNMPFFPTERELILPPWLGDERLHASHRSNLLRKFPEHYNQFGWVESPNLLYFWPTENNYAIKE